jgi:glycine dehydrogenase subunit 2
MAEPSVPKVELPEKLRRLPDDPIRLPEVTELDVVRHFTRLSHANMSIDTNFYPLGSCTMKYNPKINEEIARLPGFVATHPLADEVLCQGSLEVMYHLQALLGEITGFPGVSLQPAAGAHGELAGVLMIRAYHRARGDTTRRTILVPDSAHGTNPATVKMAGYDVQQLPSDSNGNLDLAALKAACGEQIAGVMLTNPNTLGLFEQQIVAAIDAVHQCGGLVYGDGANLNAILGVVRPADLGIDVMHLNLHKTFSTPHGGGGPGSGPVAATEALAPYLPAPVVVRGGDESNYSLAMPEHTIGRLKSFHGNFGMMLRAYAYIRVLGARGLRRVAENAVLNANYLKHLVTDIYPTRYDRRCMHEFVSAGNRYDNVSTMDVAKRLLDYGVHAPTVYFPLIVKDALMIEPTECETRETLDAFSAVLHEIAREAQEEPDLLHDAPVTTPIGRLDEVEAVRALRLTYLNDEKDP